MPLSKKMKVQLARTIERLQTSEGMRERSWTKEAQTTDADTKEKYRESAMYWWRDCDRAIIELSEEFGIELCNLKNAKRRMEDFWPTRFPN